MRVAQATAPVEGVNTFRHKLKQDERQQSPAERGQSVPESAGTSRPKQVAQEHKAQKEK
jgi:hypothetical protein